MIMHFDTEKERLDFVKKKFIEIEPKVAKKKTTKKEKSQKKVKEENEVQTD